MLSIWRKAYNDVQDIEAVPQTSLEELTDWDVSHLDSGSQENVRFLRERLRAITLQVNALRQLVTDNVAMHIDQISEPEEAVIDDLRYWIATAHLDGLSLTDLGLSVTSRSPPGTIIMDRALWDGLGRLVDSQGVSKALLDGGMANGI